MNANCFRSRNLIIEGNMIYLEHNRALIAEISHKNYRYIKLYCITDECSASAVFSKVDLPGEIEKNDCGIYIYDGVCICQNCEREILKIYEEKFFDFSCEVICECGAVYNFIRKCNFKGKSGEDFFKKTLHINENMI